MVAILATAALAATIVAVGFRRIPDDRLERWMTERDVPVNASTREVASRELQRTRRWRSGGAAAALVVVGVPQGLFMIQHPDVSPVLRFLNEHMPSAWPVVISGYLLGALVAEALSSRPQTPRRASVVPRDVSAYAPQSLRQALFVLPVVLAVFAASPTLVSVHPSWPSGPSVADLLVLAAAGLFSLIVAEAVARRIVGRPQPVAKPELMRVDDALRACSVNAAVASGVALQLLALSSALWSVGASAAPVLLRWTLPWLSVFGLGAAFWVWVSYGMTSSVWVVNRRLESTP